MKKGAVSKMADKKEKPKIEVKKDPVFPKASLIASKQFSFGDKAILEAILEDRDYSVVEAKAALIRHKRRRVI